VLHPLLLQLPFQDPQARPAHPATQALKVTLVLPVMTVALVTMAHPAKMATQVAQDLKDPQANPVAMAHPAIQVPLVIPDLKARQAHPDRTVDLVLTAHPAKTATQAAQAQLDLQASPEHLARLFQLLLAHQDNLAHPAKMATQAAQVALDLKDLLDLLDNLANPADLVSLATPADPDLKERLEHLVRMVLLAKTEIPVLQAINLDPLALTDNPDALAALVLLAKTDSPAAQALPAKMVTQAAQASPEPLVMLAHPARMDTQVALAPLAKTVSQAAQAQLDLKASPALPDILEAQARLDPKDPVVSPAVLAALALPAKTVTPVAQALLDLKEALDPLVNQAAQDSQVNQVALDLKDQQDPLELPELRLSFNSRAILLLRRATTFQHQLGSLQPHRINIQHHPVVIKSSTNNNKSIRSAFPFAVLISSIVLEYLERFKSTIALSSLFLIHVVNFRITSPQTILIPM